jgi:hypothetical protein
MTGNVSEQVSGAVAEATAGSSFRRWYWLIRLVVIAVPVIGATPTAFNLYQAWKHGIPYSQVSHKLQQYDLWVKNGACKIDYSEIRTSKDAKVNIGACPTTGDISIQVALAGGSSFFEWIDFNQLQQLNTAHAMLTTPAIAAEVPAAVPAPMAGIRVAEAAGSRVVCQGWENPTKIVRVVDEGGRCFKETIAAYSGRADKREEVPCTTTCPQQKPK